jgi:uncharacterized membrane protein SpoIIM required for sporulation
MTPLQFEAQYEADWTRLEVMVQQCLVKGRRGAASSPAVQGEQLAVLYRRACEHLALARQRAYPPYLIERLERVTADAHQLIYQRRQFGAAAFREFIARGFPRTVRQHRYYVLAAALLFLVPTVVVGVLIHERPDLVLSVMDANTADMFEQMYSEDGESIGRRRDVNSDWAMFGYYIRNNVGVSFQCFAGGLFLGLGSIFYLVFNGAYAGAVAGYLTERGLGHTFYSFVVTHSSFELTAIVLSGAAGLRLGNALLAPRRLTRRASLVRAAGEVAPMVYGFALMLLVAAAIEGFWSSAAWLPGVVRYSVAGACWAGVLSYFIWQGRRAD